MVRLLILPHGAQLKQSYSSSPCSLTTFHGIAQKFVKAQLFAFYFSWSLGCQIRTDWGVG